jgi:hypothetical protein
VKFAGFLPAVLSSRWVLAEDLDPSGTWAWKTRKEASNWSKRRKLLLLGPRIAFFWLVEKLA